MKTRKRTTGANQAPKVEPARVDRRSTWREELVERTLAEVRAISAAAGIPQRKLFRPGFCLCGAALGPGAVGPTCAGCLEAAEEEEIERELSEAPGPE